MPDDGDQDNGSPAVPPRRGDRRKPGQTPFSAASPRSGRSSRSGAPKGQQASFRARKRRQQQLAGGGVVAVVIVVIVVLVAVGLGSKAKSGPTGSSDVTTATLDSVTSIGVGQISSTYDAQKVSNEPIKVGGPLLTSGGKPEVLYLGAEYCPYCAGERWSMVLALSKFGTFADLHSITSSASDDPASIPTYTFVDSTFTSPYITFTPVEEQTVDRQPLQSPSPAQQALFSKYDAPPYVPSQSAGGIPFFDMGNYAVQDGLGYDIDGQGDSALSGLTFSHLAGEVAQQQGANAAAITAEAGVLISDICHIDGGRSLDGDAACKAFPTPITQGPQGA